MAVTLPEQFGRYRILRRLGRGGMGTVYLAHDAQLDRQVALKVPSFAPDDGPEVLQRFSREARAAATIQHPNICPLYDVGEIQGIPYVTMAYIEGKSLAEVVQGGKPLPQGPAAAVVRKLALAMQEAHRLGVIHRDLKPSNVMINLRREPVIMDFGLARRLKQGEEQLTRSGDLIGTPAYMAPEQMAGDPSQASPACDVYSLGVILYQLLTGQLPFRGPLAAVMAQVLTEEPVPPSAHRPDLDPRLEAVCRKAMAKKVEARYATMRELAAALTEYLKNAGGPPEPLEVLPVDQPAPDRSVAAPPPTGTDTNRPGGEATAGPAVAGQTGLPPSGSIALPEVSQGRRRTSPPRPPTVQPVAGAPGASRRGKIPQRSNHLVLGLVGGGGLAALLLTCCGGGLFLLGDRGVGGPGTPGGSYGTSPWGAPSGWQSPPADAAAGIHSGGGGLRLEGTYRRRYDDAAMGMGKTDFITFTADGRFQEQGFLAAALGGQMVNGTYVFYNPQAAGMGTFRVLDSTLELNYANGGSVRMSCRPLGNAAGPATTVFLNSYTFVR